MPCSRCPPVLAALLALLALVWAAPPVTGQEVPDRVLRKLARAETKQGKDAVAREFGLEVASGWTGKLGLGTTGTEYLRNLYKADNAFQPPPGSRLTALNGALTKLGGAFVVLQFGKDMAAGKAIFGPAGQNLAQGGLYTWAAWHGGPIGGIFFVSDVLGRTADYAVSQAYQDDRWWDPYVRYYRNKGNAGYLTPYEWVKLFDRNDSDLTRFNAHMDSFWQDDVYLSENLPARLSNPESAAARKLREPYRIRYFQEYLLPFLGEWAVREAESQRRKAEEEARRAVAEVIAESVLEVEVVDADTGEPLKAWVAGRYIEGTTVHEAAGIWTHLGNELKGVPPWASGTVLVQDCDGYQNRNANFLAQSPEAYNSGEVRRVRVELRPVAARLSVEVRGPDGASIPGASVVATRESGSYSGTTNSQGTASIPLPRGGSYEISARAPGYRSTGVSVTVSGTTHREVLALDAEAATLTVTVRNGQDSSPLGGATVRATSGGVTEATTTGLDGRAAVSLPPSSSVAIEVSREGFAAASLTREVTAQGATAVVDLQPRGATLSVRVGDKVTRTPLGGVRVKAIVGGAERLGTTAGDGTLTMAIPDGKKVTVRLYKEGYRVAQTTKPIVEGRASASGTLQPTGEGQIAVKLLDGASKEPVAGATVVCGGIRGRTNAEGIVYFTVPPEAQVTIEASKPGYRSRSAPGSGPKAGESKFVRWYLHPEGAAEAQEEVVFTGPVSYDRSDGEASMRITGRMTLRLQPQEGRFSASRDTRLSGESEVTLPGKPPVRRRRTVTATIRESWSGTYDPGAGTLSGQGGGSLNGTRSSTVISFQHCGVERISASIPCPKCGSRLRFKKEPSEPWSESESSTLRGTVTGSDGSGTITGEDGEVWEWTLRGGELECRLVREGR